MSAYQFSMIRPVAVADTGAFTRTGANATYYSEDNYRKTAAADTARFECDPYTKLPTGLLMEAASTNLALYSNDYTNAVWTKTGVTISTGSAVGADGNFTMSGLVGTVATSPHGMVETATVVANNPYSVSVDMVYSPGNPVVNAQIFFDDNAGNGAYVNFNVSTGVFTSTVLYGTAKNFTYSARRINYNIYRVTITVTHASTTGRFGAYLVDPATPLMALGGSWLAAVTNVIYFSSFQLEAGSATSYIGHTTSAAIARGADTNTAAMVSSIPEPATGAGADALAWNPATLYIIGNQVSRIVAGVRHEIYQRLIGGMTATAPESDTTNWVLVGKTNRWRAFDTSFQSQSSNTYAIQYQLTPGTLVDTVALDNLDADFVRLRVEGTSYDQTIQLRSRPCGNWFQYFFEPFAYKKSAVFTGLPLLQTNKITIMIYKAASTAKVGYVIEGLSRAMGYAEPSATVGILDYSTKTTDTFGNTSVVQRAYSKRMNVSVIIQNTDLDYVQDLLASYRATPVVWTAAGNLYSALQVYGYYRSFEIVIAYPTQSRCNLEIEGLT